MQINEQVPWTFKTWITHFKNVDLPIGDLANDILKDNDFPDEDYFSEIWEHISLKCKGDPDVLETFALAWNYYLASKDSSCPTFTAT